MAQTSSSKSLIIVGGGIVGLCIAVAALARGHQVTVIAKDASEDTASGIAAGMIAPAMEAMNDPDPVMSYQRLQAAQAHWWNMSDIWPDALRLHLVPATSTPSFFTFQRVVANAESDRLKLAGAPLATPEVGVLDWMGLSADFDGIQVGSDWKLPSQWTLEILRHHLSDNGAAFISGDVHTVQKNKVRLRKGGWIAGDAVVIAAGYGSKALAQQIPSLKYLSPIKGQILDIAKQKWVGVIRSANGYLATFSSGAKFGATMEPGRDDLNVDYETVSDLKSRASLMFPEMNDLDQAVPRVGIRASTPDGWPLIGRDETTGVLVATGMRRNGYVFAPLAARIVLDLVDGLDTGEGDIYRPDRFDEN